MVDRIAGVSEIVEQRILTLPFGNVVSAHTKKGGDELPVDQKVSTEQPRYSRRVVAARAPEDELYGAVYFSHQRPPEAKALLESLDSGEAGGRMQLRSVPFTQPWCE